MAQVSGANRTMRLFGLPYQFPEAVDPRESRISYTIGRNYMKNIIASAPILTIIPGRPKYLKEMDAEDKNTIAMSLIGSMGERLDPLKAKMEEARKDKKKYRFYDFKRTYTEYVRYVNILCRVCAAFLDIDKNRDSSGTIIDEDGIMEDYSYGAPFTSYDWRNYKFTSQSYSLTRELIEEPLDYFKKYFGAVVEWGADLLGNPTVKKYGETNVDGRGASDWVSNNAIVFATDSPVNSEETDNEENITEGDRYQNCVQFYVSAEDTSVDETMSNESSESQIASMISDNINTLAQELKFILGGDTGAIGSVIENVGGGLAETLTSVLGGLLGGGDITQLGAQLTQYMKSVGAGENIIFPKIYQRSDYSKRYSFEINLCATYGCRLSYYLDILVPLMHILALSLPHQVTNNSYSCPFLIKAFCEGHFTCNMGIVSSISITRNMSAEAFNADNVPNEMKVRVDVDDLLSDLMITPQNDPVLFLGNSSLIEYLTTMCGLSVISPNPEKKFEMSAVAVTGLFTDILPSIGGAISEWSDKVVTQWFSLGNF